MTLAIGAVGAARALAPIAPLPGAGAAGAVTAPAAGTTPAGGFGDALQSGLDHVQQLDDKADDLAVKAATGDLTDVHDYTIAANEASVATQLTVAVRDRAVSAFNQIMGMQV